MPEPVDDPEEDEEKEPGKPRGDIELEEEELESSWEELVAKRAESVDDEESIFDLARDDTVESLSVRATPPQSNEFICSNCRLVKHKSQLADVKRNLCRDCV